MKAVVTNTFTTLKQVSQEYARHDCCILAAAVSFYVLIAAVPFLSLAIAVIGIIYGSDKAAILHIKLVLQDNLPASGKTILDTLSQTDYSRQTLSVFGVVGIIASGTVIFKLLEVGFNRIWRINKRRNWVQRQIMAFSTTCLAIVIVGSNGIITSILAYLEAIHQSADSVTAIQIPIFWDYLGHVVTLLLAALLFALLYLMIPNRKISAKDALFGGLLSGVAWETAKYVFSYYFAHIGQYNRVYGSLGGLIILVIWTYYSVIILFMGAEVTRLHETRRRGKLLHIKTDPETLDTGTLSS